MAEIGGTLDCLGRVVRVGSVVRVLALSTSFLASLPDDERNQIAAMIGRIFTVNEIDEFGAAWVTEMLEVTDGEYDGHGIALAPSEMELVNDRAA